MSAVSGPESVPEAVPDPMPGSVPDTMCATMPDSVPDSVPATMPASGSGPGVRPESGQRKGPEPEAEPESASESASESGPEPLSPSQNLCRSCGLCCDGSLFWAVEFEAGDVRPDTVAPDSHLAQPCQFHDHTGCAIYATRPAQCRAFTCRVLAAVQDGTHDTSWAETRIEAMRHLLAGLDAVLPGKGGLYGRAAAYLEDAAALPDDARIRARIAIYKLMIGDFRPLSDTTDPSLKPR